MRIGIYLAHAPAKNPSYKQEGLGRLLAYLVKAMDKNGHQIVLATASWSIEALQDLFESYGIDNHTIEALVSDYEPQLLRIYMKYFGIKKPKRNHRLKKAAVAWIDRWVEYAFKIRHFFTLMFFLLVAAVVMVVMLPFGAAGVCLYAIIHVIKRFLLKQEIGVEIKKSITDHFVIAGIRRHIHVKYLEENMVLQYFRSDMAEDLLRKIKRMKNPVDIWFCPMAFWPEFNRIPGRKVICAPDLVVSDYASNYSSMLADVKNIQNIRSTITEGKYFITYCEYLKDSLLIQEFGKKSNDIVAIPHAVNNMMDEILLSDHYLTGCMNSNLFQRHARAILGTVVSNADQTDYIGKGFYGFSFQDVKYIFYASQLRGSKNILNLVRAYHKLLRKNHVQVKLFLTCRLYEGADVTAYIREHNLQYDVLSFWGVSQQQLAALYACAELVVNPTFYEGGFPFTFGEGMSVGTPSVMGKIPQIMDVAQGYSLEKYMFDPYNVEDMVEKISYALSHTEEVYEAEKALYEELDKRSWGDVGEEYVKTFEMFLSRK